MNIAQTLASAQTLGVARLDAQLLLLHALGRAGNERAWLIAHDTDAVPDAASAAFMEHVRRRVDGEPVAYIVGAKEFLGLDLQVDARVLVPRPETETLVEWGLESISGISGASVLDLGTGSGAIALAIKHGRPDAAVTSADASADALLVARANARRLMLDVAFLHGSWFGPVRGQHHLIVSNPPYVPEQDPHLTALAHEPLQALASGADGLDDIREIVVHAPQHLYQGGWLLLEHGYDQAPAVRALLSQAGFAHIQSRVDLAGIERCSGGQWPARG